MKLKKYILTAVTLAGLAAGITGLRAGDTNQLTLSPPKDIEVKPYPLDHCIVSGDKFGGDMGKPITNYYNGQQIIFCCKDCPRDFKKDPDKYLKQIAEEAKKAK